MTKTKIVIAGIGGVGGYFGGMLAKHYINEQSVEISFLARGENLKEIQAHGLKVLHNDKEFIAQPTIATSNADEIGPVDFILICTKSYNLEEIVQQLAPCISPNTILIPLLNGVNSRERIQEILPKNLVLDGCVYIVGRLKQAGVVENGGKMQTLFFGLDNVENAQCHFLEKLLKDAGIEATYSQEISKIIWEKYVFISPTATATSFYDKSISDLLKEKEIVESIDALTDEIISLALAKQIDISADSKEKVMKRLQSMPPGATSSMHSDYKANKPQTELQALTGYVLDEGETFKLEMPAYKRMYEGLKRRINK